ncbi:MAG: glycosyl transferase family 1 [Bacteroidia bacterium]|nr:glycosyl transferase family 1 [Bacteroidia bacterium]
MKKVLIILYYWPPAGGGGVQRWLKFTKYLPEFGWEPIVYAPENPDYPLQDPSLVADIPKGLTVIKHPIWEARKAVAGLFPRKENNKNPKGKKKSLDGLFYLDPSERSFKDNLTIWIRGNFFIPDARMTWVKPSIKFLSQYLKENPVDAIATTGPPHSIHLIGKGLKKKTGLPWYCDMRDPWTNIEFFEHLMLSNWAERKHRRLEKAVLTGADHVNEVGKDFINYDKSIGVKNIDWLPNGYDDKDFEGEKEAVSPHFMISHIGTFEKDRSLDSLYFALNKLSEEFPDFRNDLRIQLAGKISGAVIEDFENEGLGENLVNLGYISHKEAIQAMQRSQLLLILINQSERNAKGKLTGKIFEYLASERPILIIGPEDGDAANVMNECQGGVACDFEDRDKLVRILKEKYLEYKEIGSVKSQSQGYEKYSRKNLSKALAELLDRLGTK